MPRDIELQNKINLLADGLHKITQDGYRSSLRQLSLYEFHVWFDKDKLNNKRLPCYLRYLYKKDNNSPVEVEYLRVDVYNYLIKRNYSSPNSWTNEKIGVGKFISVYQYDKDRLPFAYPMPFSEDDFRSIGLFVDPKSDWFSHEDTNPIFEIREWIDNN